MLKIIKNIVLLLALFVLSIANNLSAHSDKGAYNHNWHNDKPYNTGSGLNNSARWMEEISDNVYLSQLALPGTHDSFTGADDNQHHNVCRTQAYGATITNQLKAGIRVLDLRIFLENTEVKLRHGNTNFCGSPLTLISTINEINNFLKYIGPKETLIVMISHESKDRVSAELKEKTTHIIRRSTQFYKMPYFNPPTIGSLRGKFIVFARDDAFEDLGLSYKIITLHQIRKIFTNQDVYHMKTNWDITYKWTAIKEHYKITANDTSAQNTAYYPSTFWINHLTGSGGSYPYFVASGHSSNGTNAPRLSTGCTTVIKGCRDRYAEFPKGACFGSWCSYYFEGMARMFMDNYKKIVPNPKRTMGIIMLDFPGKDIIQTIINDNARLKLTKK